MNRALYFLLGAIVGAAGSYFYFEGKYKEACKEFYDEKYKERQNQKEDEMYAAEEKPEDASVEDPENYISEKPDIVTYAKEQAKARKSKKKKKEVAYVIDRDEYINSEYDCKSLMYYRDDVLIYEDTNKKVEDADTLLGTDFKSKFGEEDDNTVYVRNDEVKMDFEIFRDVRTYKEVIGETPHGSEDE